jgi:hypothetical protein
MIAEELAPALPRRRGIAGNAVLLWLLAGGFYYSWLLTAGGTTGLLSPINHGLTFNSMLLHLLHGRFDVDPAVIGEEGYLRDGAIYAYFGIFPALFRSLFLWLPDFAQVDLTRVSCLAAVAMMALAKLLSVRLMWQQADRRRSQALLALMSLAVVASGPQIQFLRPSIYQEVELWAGAQAAVFIYLVLRGLTDARGFTPRLLTAMATVAGLALLTRVSLALGLYLALGFICLRIGWRAIRTWSLRELVADIGLPLVVLTAFLVLTGLINFERWGSPLSFVDFTRALSNVQWPERLGRLQRDGEFNITRLAYGVGYYFAPFWILRDASGQFVWTGFDGIGACCVELPPSSFLVSDPLLIGLCVYGALQVLRKGAARRELIAAATLGLAVPGALMLVAASMTFRYRMEFYPVFELLAFLGFARLAAKPADRTPVLFAVTAVAGMIAAHAIWLLYMMSPLGPAAKVMGPLGIVDFYYSIFQ